jgi:ABC-type multidrug transport system ATPase subunit
MEQNTTAVRTTGLTKTYDGIDRVRNLDLEIRKGEIYGFLGPNGAGKSTTMKMLLGLSRPSAGEIEILGTTLNDKTRPEILSRVGSIIESPSYYGHLSASENMKIIETLLDLPEGRGDRALRIVRLYDQKDRRVREFSLGMKQRLAIAMALARNPELLILDEPVNGLDPAGIEEVRELLLELAKEHGITIMISSHLLSEIEKTVDHLGIIDHGELVYQGSVEDLNRSRQPGFVLETDDPAGAEAVLAPLHPGTEDNSLILPQLDRKQRASIVRRLTENGVPVCGLYPKQKSLEELFLEITGRELTL